VTGDPNEPLRAGLCAACLHAEKILSSRQTVFYRCGLSDVDPRFPRYPTLPVLGCAGYEPVPAIADSEAR
jgi:hypothetical protein